MRRFAILAVSLALSAGLRAEPPAGRSAPPLLTTSASATDATDAAQFGCADTVYVHIAWDPPMPAAHRLRADWRNTATGLTHVSDLSTTPNTPASWMWLRYEAPSGAGYGRLLAPEGTDGGFAGPWTVIITLDGRPLGEKRFEVQC